MEAATATPATQTPTAPSAAALEPRLYTDPALLEAEQRLIFERTWQLAGHVSSLPAPGSYITADAGDQPVLVVRDEDGGLRAYRNVCRHRGSRLLSGSGQCKAAIRCRYHGWTYKLDGTLIGVPEGLGFGDQLDKPAPRPAAGARRGALRARVRQPRPRRDAAGRAGRRGAAAAPGALPDRDARVVRPRDRDPAGQLEGGRRQLPRGLPHPDRPSGADADARLQALRGRGPRPLGVVRVAAARQAVEQPARAAVRAGDQADAGARATPTGGVWRYAFIYPNTTIDLYPDQVNTWQMLPDGVSQTRDTFGGYRAAGADPRTRVAQWANQKLNTLVLDEDIDLVANVQRGLQTRGYRCGPLGAREAGVAWFADRIRDVARRRGAGAVAAMTLVGDRRRHPRADPRRRGATDRLGGNRRRPDRPDRDGRRRLELARPLPLRHARGTAGAGARMVLRARRAPSARRSTRTPTRRTRSGWDGSSTSACR